MIIHDRTSQTKSYFNIESHNDKRKMFLKHNNLIHFVYPIKFMQEVISMKKKQFRCLLQTIMS